MADSAPDLAAIVIDRLTAEFEANRDAERAGPMSAYMKNQFPFLGIPAPRQRAIAGHALRGLLPPSEPELVAVVTACWDKAEREYQYFGVNYITKHIGRCSVTFIESLERSIAEKPWWDTVDGLAKNGVGRLVSSHPHELLPVLERWIDDDNLWLARAAILHQLGYKDRTDPDLLFRYCLHRAADRDFFMRKAIGWALRQYSWTNPDAVCRFVDDHESALSGLTRREALKHVNRRT